MSAFRQQIYFNPSAQSWVAPPTVDPSLVDAFHRKLPDYSPTRLVPLPSVAKKLGVGAVYIKEESNRMGVPSFKILGASWGAFRAVTQKLNLPLDCELADVRGAAKVNPTTLFAATAGNHGRAVARVGSILGLPTEIFVPTGMHADTMRFITDEGASLTVVPGDYDAAVRTASESSVENDGILVQDTAWDGYEDIPNWIVQGYTTLLSETSAQLPPHHAPTHVLAPVGVGSFAQAVVSHFASSSPHPSIITVEPDTAACLHAALSTTPPPTTTPSPIPTTPTILAGLNCGTISHTAWPLLAAGVSAAATISDHEAHLATTHLHAAGIDAGPCGGAGLAALRRLALVPEARAKAGLSEASVVVLLCTEGGRKYDEPRAVDADDAPAIAQSLVKINSVNPAGGGAGETDVVHWIAAWLAHRGIETHVVGSLPGRPSVVGVVRGTGGGKSLMLNGHVDTVTLAGYEGDGLEGKVEGGRLYGRGAADMKGGVAAMMAALVRCKDVGLRGDVIFAGVADEEDLSIGTEAVLAAGWRADAAVVGEPSDLGIVTAHKGFVWLEVDVRGVAAHGSRPDLGVDAIAKAGYLLVELERYGKRLQEGRRHGLLGTGSVHASVIKGGEEASSYPAKCTVTLERRTVPGESVELVRQEVEDILEKLKGEVEGFEYDLRVTFSRSTFEIDREHPFVSLVAHHAKNTTGMKLAFLAEPFWTDCALLSDAGIPVVIYGPKGEGLHAKTEWVDLASVEAVAKTLTILAKDFCK